jgi:hypothetical protein
VKKHYCLIDALPKSDIFEIFPCIIASQKLCTALAIGGCSGFVVKQGLFEPSQILNELHPGTVLPPLSWCEITGEPCENDFGLERATRLITSEKAKAVIERGRHDEVTFMTGTQAPTDAEITKRLFENAKKVAKELRKRRSGPNKQ